MNYPWVFWQLCLDSFMHKFPSIYFTFRFSEAPICIEMCMKPFDAIAYSWEITAYFKIEYPFCQFLAKIVIMPKINLVCIFFQGPRVYTTRITREYEHEPLTRFETGG